MKEIDLKGEIYLKNQNAWALAETIILHNFRKLIIDYGNKIFKELDTLSPLNKILTYREMMERIKEIYRKYSNFLDYQTIGVSHDGRKIPMLKIGYGEKCLICSGGVHGRESINPTILLEILESYLRCYQEGQVIDGKYDICHFLDTCSICMIPVLNPDGHVIAMEGFEEIKDEILREKIVSRNIPYEEWKFNGRGIDVNRNFPCASFNSQASSRWAGSENETKALINVFNENDTIAYIDFHSRGEVIYYYRSAMPYAYNQKCKKLALCLQEITGYDLGNQEEEFSDVLSGGNTVNFYSENFKKPAITIETLPDEAGFPLQDKYLKDTYWEIYLVLLEVIKRQIFT